MASDARLEIFHVVCSDAFAGVEHYVAYTANALSMLGHGVSVIGGDPSAMSSMLKPSGVQFLPGPNEWGAVRMLSSMAMRRNQPDLVHVHMTKAELAAIVTKPLLRRPVVTTLHFARTRGSTPLRHQLWRLPTLLYRRTDRHQRLRRTDCRTGLRHPATWRARAVSRRQAKAA